MNKAKWITSIAALNLLLLGGCASNTSLKDDTPQRAVAPTASPESAYKDTTQVTPNWEYLESAKSKYVIVGSATFAAANGCQFLQRYAVRTNADFPSTLNLLKNRSALMGGNWVTIVGHSEIDLTELPKYKFNSPVMVREGTVLTDNRYLTEMIGDLYDCPCGTTACSTKADK